MKRRVIQGAKFGTPDSPKKTSTPSRPKRPKITLTKDLIAQGVEKWFNTYLIPEAEELKGYSFAGSTFEIEKIEYLRYHDSEIGITGYMHIPDSVQQYCISDVHDWEADTDKFYLRLPYLPQKAHYWTSSEQVYEYLADSTDTEWISVRLERILTLDDIDKYIAQFESEIDDIINLNIQDAAVSSGLITNISVQDEYGSYPRNVEFEDISHMRNFTFIVSLSRSIADVYPAFQKEVAERGDTIIDDYTIGVTRRMQYLRFSRSRNPHLWTTPLIKDYTFEYLYNYLEKSANMSDKELWEVNKKSVWDSISWENIYEFPFTVQLSSNNDIIVEFLRDEEHTYGGKPIKIKFANLRELPYDGNRWAVRDLRDKFAKRYRRAFNYRMKEYGDEE